MPSALMEQALDAANVALIVLDQSGRIAELTPPAARLLDGSIQEIVGKAVSDLLPICPFEVLDIVEQRVDREERVLELSREGQSPSLLHLAVSIRPFVDPDGNRWAAARLRDVTSRKDSERDIQKALLQSDHAIRGANIGVFHYDVATQSVSVSDIWRSLLELEPFEDVDVQKEWRSRVHPDDLEAALEPVRLCLEEAADRARCEYRLRSRDGSCWRWMQTDIAVALRNKDGKPSALVGAQTDVTHRKLVEEALRSSAEELRQAFDHAPIGKAIVSRTGQFLSANPALCDLLGYSAEDLARTDLASITHAGDMETDVDLFESLLKNETTSYSADKRFIRSNGAIMWGSMSVALVHDEEGRPDRMILQIIDISEQRRLNQMKSDFVSVVSHELRTPLTAVLSALTLLSLNNQSQFSDEVQRLLFIARTNGERLHSLINDILDFQKFSAQQMRFKLSRIPVPALVEDAIMANLATADIHEVRFVPDIPDRSMFAWIDPKRFLQVMANILSNAAKFATPGSVVTVLAERQGNEIRISVTNRGSGIPAEFQTQVFLPFAQAGTTSSRRSGGTGLGLSITKQIVEQMGGRIGFDSVPDDTTTFWFTVQSAEDEYVGPPQEDY